MGKAHPDPTCLTLKKKVSLQAFAQSGALALCVCAALVYRSSAVKVWGAVRAQSIKKLGSAFVGGFLVCFLFGAF